MQSEHLTRRVQRSSHSHAPHAKHSRSKIHMSISLSREYSDTRIQIPMSPRVGLTCVGRRRVGLY